MLIFCYRLSRQFFILREGNTVTYHFIPDFHSRNYVLYPVFPDCNHTAKFRFT